MSTVLITGCSRGIGLETALAFARKGHTVRATMRHPQQAPELAEIAAAEGLPITVRQMDVNSDDSVRNAIAELLVEGPIDVLVNNAGVEAVGSIEEQSLSLFRSIMETNYFGVLRCVQAVVPGMRERRSGCIINVSSIAGLLSCPPLTPYCSSKWALEAFTEALACEMKTFGVHVAIMEPGIIDTEMARRISIAPGESPYRQGARLAAVFAGSLQRPVSPGIVAEKILTVATSGTWQLRHLVGPDAAPFVLWRRQMSDEEWVDVNAADDATFFGRLAEMQA